MQILIELPSGKILYLFFLQTTTPFFREKIFFFVKKSLSKPSTEYFITTRNISGQVSKNVVSFEQNLWVELVMIKLTMRINSHNNKDNLKYKEFYALYK